ncbi:MAG: diaminopimelate epimerase [Bryobacterales bacterium]|nr:diaminopimelate epimerase [Bryobacteraceae bacterium]MDW8354171.1 diaminopimelate epimerase [Bryobacterales bacterium]
MRIPFTKAHGAGNDFLLTWSHEAPSEDQPAVARAICSRHTGVGADGWILVSPPPKDAAWHGEIRLYNADGSRAEFSGNGTRCAAAFLLSAGVEAELVRVRTGAGLRELRLLERDGLRFVFEIGMGRPVCGASDLRASLELADTTVEATIVDVGNPQCAVFVEQFDFDWRRLGAALEAHPRFPHRTNVSFVRVADRHTLEIRFWERGVGETMSSGTGATGAAWAAHLRGLVETPVAVLTPGGRLELRWDEQVYLAGPAEIVAGGEYYLSG